MNVAIIPARGGSQRIPRKNIKLFHGKPILAYSIETAKESGLFDIIVVSTDDVEIATVAYWNGASTHQRSAKKAQNEVGTQEVAREVLEDLSKSVVIDYACVIYPTSPLLETLELKEAFFDLVENPLTDYVYSVDGKDQDAGAFYWGKYSSFMNGVPLDSKCSIKFQILNPCDINTPEDWDTAERLYEVMGEY